MARSFRLSAGVLVFLTLVATPCAVLAQSAAAAEEPNQGVRAIEVGNDGIALYEQGRWNDALERFRRADALYHSPVFVLYAARTLRNSGRLLEARDAFRTLGSERLPPSAPELWKQAQRDGAAELVELETRIPSVRIQVEGASVGTPLLIDGRSFTPRELLELDPGQHQIVAGEGPRQRKHDFLVAPGMREETIVLKLSPAGDPARAVQLAAPRGAESEQRSPPSVLRITGLVAIGIGGAALIAGGVVGVIALDKKSKLLDDLPASCEQTTCPPSAQGEVDPIVDEVHDFAKAADMLFIGGAAVAAVGVGLLVFAPGDAPPETANVSVRASLRRADVRIRF